KRGSVQGTATGPAPPWWRTGRLRVPEPQRGSALVAAGADRHAASPADRTDPAAGRVVAATRLPAALAGGGQSIQRRRGHGGAADAAGRRGRPPARERIRARDRVPGPSTGGRAGRGRRRGPARGLEPSRAAGPPAAAAGPP